MNSTTVSIADAGDVHRHDRGILHRLPVSRLEFQLAARFADQHSTGLRSGDALHLAIASSHGARLCSLDQVRVTAAEAWASVLSCCRSKGS